MIKEKLENLIARRDLSADSMCEVMNKIMKGELTEAQIGAFITALRIKGESIEEVVGAARAMRQNATFIDAGAGAVIDTCGTGGDGSNTFNISTTAAFVTSGAGITVAKHGNRSITSKCGSSEVLAALGVNLNAEPVVMEQCIQEHGIGFLFAPKMHPAMKNVAPVRQQLGIRTIFNMLGPLTNPAGATGQVLGVFSPVLTEMFAAALRELGCRRALVVHGNDGLDEITCTTSTRITELRDGRIRTFEFFPDLLIGDYYPKEDIIGGEADENAEITKAILTGKEQGAPRKIVLLNAAAAIVSGEIADSLDEGVKLAEESIDSGAAYEKLQRLVEFSNQ